MKENIVLSQLFSINEEVIKTTSVEYRSSDQKGKRDEITPTNKQTKL